MCFSTDKYYQDHIRDKGKGFFHGTENNYQEETWRNKGILE